MNNYTKEELLEKGLKEVKQSLNVDCVNCLGCVDCLRCLRCKDCLDCVNCLRCKDCKDCKNCVDCLRCKDCLFSQNQKDKQYIVFNIQLTEEEYKGFVSK